MLTKETLIGENAMSHDDKVAYFEQLLKQTNREGVDKVIDFVRRTDFYTAPASAKYHSNYDGGLLDHSLMVYTCATELYSLMSRIDPEISLKISTENVIIAALLHDICKTCFYRKTLKWTKNEFNEYVSYDGYEIEDTFPIGHGEKSIIMLQNIGLSLDPCEMLAIRYHMGYWGESNFEFKATLTNAIKMCPLVVLLQEADFMASTILEREVLPPK